MLTRDANWLMLRAWCPALVMLAACAGTPGTPAGSATLYPNGALEDLFERDLTDAGVTVVDWEGYLANPAIALSVHGPAAFKYPVQVTLTGDEARLYFDEPSDVAASGPTRKLTLLRPDQGMGFAVSIAPDRDALDEDHPLKVAFASADGVRSSLTVNLHVIDQDLDPAPPPSFQVTIDFGKDQTGFFADEAHRNIVRQAADDWAYFLDDMHLQSVDAGAETTWIWNSDGYHMGTSTTNASAYIGYLLYAYGIHDGSALRSGGEGSAAGGFQTNEGGTLPIRRSGGFSAETAGNYNTLGWSLTLADSDWWAADNLKDANELLSIAHHEIGHALFFNPANTRYEAFAMNGKIDDPEVVAYHGAPVAVNASDHFDGELDNDSRKGAFGDEYHGDMPRKRWLATRLDLLCAKAIGYSLRPTSALVPLQLTTTSLPDGHLDSSYLARAQAVGGIPFYRWSVADGTLPPGLSLDSFSGALSGTPTASGHFAFSLKVQDYHPAAPGVVQAMAVDIGP